jgi:uncharacterized protein
MQDEVQSPCISVCVMDEKTGICQGCYRTMEEIEKWWDLDNVGKAAVLKAAAEREAAVFD